MLAIKILAHRWGMPAIKIMALDKVKSLRTKVKCLRVHSVWGSERDSNGRFPRWVWRPLEATERLKQYVSFTLKKWDCINPLGFARPINPSLNHHSISLKSISTHNVYKLVFGLVWFGLVWFWGATSCRSVCYHNNNKLENHLFNNTWSLTNHLLLLLLLSRNSAWWSISTHVHITEELHLQQVTAHLASWHAA